MDLISKKAREILKDKPAIEIHRAGLLQTLIRLDNGKVYRLKSV